MFLNNLFPQKKYKILSLDGGGFRAFFTICVMKELEQRYQLDFYQNFDLLAGTSAGAIIIGGLASGIPIKEIYKLYKDQKAKIFSKKSKSLFGLKYSLYHSSYLEGFLSNLFGDIKIGQLKKDILIPSFNISTGEFRIFCRQDEQVRLVDAIMCSTAAPFYFDPHKLNKQLYIDGGVWANDPAHLALIEALINKQKKIKNLQILSLGTGTDKSYFKTLRAIKKNQWGLYYWNKKIIKILQELPWQSTAVLLDKLLSPKQYLRINFTSEDKVLDLDNVRLANYYEEEAKKCIAAKSDSIKSFLVC